ncbi:MAG: hypothetical protein RIR64_600 [Bacteroidota bacterium]|jgi:hypothetical protein
MNEVEKILEAFGTKVVEDLRKSLSEKLQAKASRYQSKYNSGSTNPGESALGASIKYRIVDSSEGIKLNVYLNDYWEAVDTGRKPAGVLKEAKIDKWIKKRNIISSFQKSNLEARLARQKNNKTKREKKVLTKLSFADALEAMDFLVRRKLQNKGYEGIHFFNEVMEDGRQQQLTKDIAAAMKKDIEIIIKTNRYEKE